MLPYVQQLLTNCVCLLACGGYLEFFHWNQLKDAMKLSRAESEYDTLTEMRVQNWPDICRKTTFSALFTQLLKLVSVDTDPHVPCYYQWTWHSVLMPRFDLDNSTSLLVGYDPGWINPCEQTCNRLLNPILTSFKTSVGHQRFALCAWHSSIPPQLGPLRDHQGKVRPT